MNPHEKYDAAMRCAWDWLKVFGAFVLFLAIVAGTVLTAETLLLDGVIKPVLGLEQWPGWIAWLGRLGAFTVAAAVLLGIVKGAVRLSGRLLRVETQRQTFRVAAGEKIDDCKGLVVFLSKPSKSHAQTIDRIRKSEVSLTDILREPADASDRWNWQPIFVGICLCSRDKHPLNVAVITSKGSDGTDALYPTLKEIVEKLTPHVRLQQVNDVDFFDSHSISNGLERAISFLKSAGVSDRNMIIDITSGTANVSAVGSMFALQEGRRIIYSGRAEDNAPVSEVYHARVQFLGDLQSGL